MSSNPLKGNNSPSLRFGVTPQDERASQQSFDLFPKEFDFDLFDFEKDNSGVGSLSDLELESPNYVMSGTCSSSERSSACTTPSSQITSTSTLYTVSTHEPVTIGNPISTLNAVNRNFDLFSSASASTASVLSHPVIAPSSYLLRSIAHTDNVFPQQNNMNQQNDFKDIAVIQNIIERINREINDNNYKIRFDFVDEIMKLKNSLGFVMEDMAYLLNQAGKNIPLIINGINNNIHILKEIMRVKSLTPKQIALSLALCFSVIPSNVIAGASDAFDTSGFHSLSLIFSLFSSSTADNVVAEEFDPIGCAVCYANGPAIKPEDLIQQSLPIINSAPTMLAPSVPGLPFSALSIEANSLTSATNLSILKSPASIIPVAQASQSTLTNSESNALINNKKRKIESIDLTSLEAVPKSYITTEDYIKNQLYNHVAYMRKLLNNYNLSNENIDNDFFEKIYGPNDLTEEYITSAWVLIEYILQLKCRLNACGLKISFADIAAIISPAGNAIDRACMELNSKTSLLAEIIKKGFFSPKELSIILLNSGIYIGEVISIIYNYQDILIIAIVDPTTKIVNPLAKALLIKTLKGKGNEMLKEIKNMLP